MNDDPTKKLPDDETRYDTQPTITAVLHRLNEIGDNLRAEMGTLRDDLRAEMGTLRDDLKAVARGGHARQAQGFDGEGRRSILDAAAAIVEQRLHSTQGTAGDQQIADMQRTALHE